MRKPKTVATLIITLAIFIGVGWFVPFEYHNDGYCGESPLYRYKLGIYLCEYDDEAGPGIHCYYKRGDFWNYIGLKKLDCEVKARI